MATEGMASATQAWPPEGEAAFKLSAYGRLWRQDPKAHTWRRKLHRFAKQAAHEGVIVYNVVNSVYVDWIAEWVWRCCSPSHTCFLSRALLSHLLFSPRGLPPKMNPRPSV